jgi:peptidyl-prolyl cis-trans isomerase A (cyclophilin A)
MRLTSLAALVGIMLAACSGGGSSTDVDAGESAPDAAEVAGDFSVVFQTTAGEFTVDVTRDWSPNGAERFGDLVDAEYYDGCRFFRVVPGFMVQFGINGTPATHAMWKDSTIQDDAVVESNIRGYVSFAQTAEPNSRTTQLFINYVDNSFLDPMNFSPFGVIRSGGMDVVDAINSEYGENPDQGQITNVGTSYLDSNFPNLDFVETARRIP